MMKGLNLSKFKRNGDFKEATAVIDTSGTSNRDYGRKKETRTTGKWGRKVRHNYFGKE